jgi:anti-anti-sigma regulatory factor
MTCRIDRLVTAEGGVVLSLSGRITAQTLDMLHDMLGQESGPVAIDLNGVLLVDSDAVQFLAIEEAKGIELRNCPAYIREWIARERAQPKPGSERRDS